MPRTSTDHQPTPLSGAMADPLGGVAQQKPPVRPKAKDKATALPHGIARRTGVVFVHGIGTQQPAETFLDWSGPIVDLLTEWRRDQEAAKAAVQASEPAAVAMSSAVATPISTPDPAPDVIVDPVRRGAFSFNAASPPFLEIAVPEHAGIPETTWVVTEAWWAADLRAPDLGRTIGYLRSRIQPIVSGISAGYRGRNDNLVDLARQQGLIGPGDPPMAWRAIDLLDQVQAKVFGAAPIGWVIGAAGTAVLAGYDLLRRIPIGPVRDFAARKMIDSFLVDWFGDLPVLIDDAVQAANVRARLAGSIRGLHEQGCDAVVIVAHSGGALVSFETLLDPVYLGPEYRVDKLVTLGQGLGLAWRLAADPRVREITPGHRLVGNLARARPDLRWVDFWASFDPAPAGPLPARGGITSAARMEGGPQVAAVVETGEGQDGESWLVRTDVGTNAEVREAVASQAVASNSARPASAAGAAGAAAPAAGRLIEVESRPITNEMNVMTDHGGYWANDEGFLVPLVRHIDAALGGADASRFYRDREPRTRRIIWRRQRVSALAAWDWLCSMAAIVTLGVMGIGAIVAGDRRLADAGNGIATAWDFVPGEEIVSGTVDGIGGLVRTMAGALGREAAVDWLGSLGPALLGAALVVALYLALAKVGNWRWHDWDRRERILFRPERPTAPDRRRTAAQAIALLGGLVALVIAMWTGVEAWAFTAWAAGAILGLLRWAVSAPVPADRRRV